MSDMNRREFLYLLAIASAGGLALDHPLAFATSEYVPVGTSKNPKLPAASVSDTRSLPDR